MELDAVYFQYESFNILFSAKDAKGLTSIYVVRTFEVQLSLVRLRINVLVSI